MSEGDARIGYLCPDETLARAGELLLQAVMVRAAVAADDCPAQLGSRLAALLDGERRRLENGLPPTGQEDTGRALTAFFRVILARRGPDVHDYLTGAIGYSPETDTGRRHDCGRRLLSLELVPRWTTAPRRLYVCERCGPAYSLPHGFGPPTADRTAGPGIRLTFPAPLPAGGWFVTCLQPVGGHEENAGVPHRLAPGVTTLDVSLPNGTYPGLRRLAVALVTAGDYSTFQFPIQQQAVSESSGGPVP
ncbi:hypothetical protein [Streptomyces cavernae]|uniref:hypothetical protein n=1 Tax=Streptomyces cavernae TaxID=2259034 RepID=UPI000FEBFCD4|nr:hypothetical protein [Streptomyces cavernae]